MKTTISLPSDELPEETRDLYTRLNLRHLCVTQGTFVGVMAKSSRPYMDLRQIDIEILESLHVVLFYL